MKFTYVAHVRQSRPDFALGFQVQELKNKSFPLRSEAVHRLVRLYLTQSVFKVILQKSTPPQICQLIFYYY